MISETEARAAAEQFCERYIKAFEKGDADAVGAHWSFPAVITAGPRVVSFDNSDAFLANTSALNAFYAEQNMGRVRREVEAVLPLSDDVFSMRVHDRMFDRDGALIVEWRSGYMLRRCSDGFRAFSAIADGEVAAWAARGTPLGKTTRKETS